jgi:hypothetical protein
MSLQFAQEKLFGYPLKDGSISFGKISQQNAQAYFLLNNSALLSANIQYPSITVNLPSIQVANIPFQKPTLEDFGTATFPYRGKIWTVIEVVLGSTYSIGGQSCYYTYTLTAIDTATPQFSIG